MFELVLYYPADEHLPSVARMASSLWVHSWKKTIVKFCSALWVSVCIHFVTSNHGGGVNKTNTHK